MRSDSCATSLMALEVRYAWPLVSAEASIRKGARRTPPLRRVKAPEAQESRMASRTSAGMAWMRVRSSS